MTLTEVGIGEHPDAARLVASLNGGNETVTMVVRPDVTTPTNSSVREIQAAPAG